ncbi:hypothetical protein LOZ66_001384 [Ophidiomyces ophidiicola]|nr:hypothetical protein LOZ66_001384 [Ophidiomyces ophidiicola]
MAFTRQEFVPPGDYVNNEFLQPYLLETQQILVSSGTGSGLLIDNDIDVLQHYPLDSNEGDHPGTRLVGLLLTNIENKGTLKELAFWSDCANNDRLCSSRQIHQSAEQLHNADVVWGDAKLENVLIDTKGDAWLIDFGGSYTPGWIDKDKRETVEGGWQGVQRIDKWLTKYSCKPVPRINKLIEKEQ